jgi:hypothetical protein
LAWRQNLMLYTTPYAGWQRVKSCSASIPCFVDTTAIGGNAAYALADEGSDTQWTTSLAMYPSVNVREDGRAGHVFGGVSAHTGSKNDGFTDSPQSGSTVQSDGLVSFVGVGYGIELAPVRMSVMLAMPLVGSHAPIAYGPTAFLSLGADLAL